jgi:hypothetical protein
MILTQAIIALLSLGACFADDLVPLGAPSQSAPKPDAKKGVTYIRPSIEKGLTSYRVDACLIPGFFCGKDAAWEFCRRMGHEGNLLSFEIDHNVDQMTMHVGEEDSFCGGDGRVCDSFKYIICPPQRQNLVPDPTKGPKFGSLPVDAKRKLLRRQGVGVGVTTVSFTDISSDVSTKDIATGK